MAAAAKQKSKMGLMIGLALLVIFVGGGAVFGLAMSGKINIPGITPKKKPIAAAVAKQKTVEPVIEPKEKKEEKVVAKPQTPEEIKQGAVKLAEVWNEVPTDKLSKVVSKWKPSELALVLNEMDPTKAAEVIAEMDEKTASAVSRALRNVAADIPSQ